MCIDEVASAGIDVDVHFNNMLAYIPDFKSPESNFSFLIFKVITGLRSEKKVCMNFSIHILCLVVMSNISFFQ